jgi:hypothetical protein
LSTRSPSLDWRQRAADIEGFVDRRVRRAIEDGSFARIVRFE